MNDNGSTEIILAEPRGFCAGVDRAIDIVEHALAKFGAPIYVRHEIVHNTHVVDDLRARGAIFIEDLNDVPPDATLVFSAHGVPKEVEYEAERRGFRVFDATCPLVTKVHVEVAKLHKEGYEFIMIGHKGHPEVEGTMGQLPSGIHLVEDAEDVQKVQPAQTRKLAVVTCGRRRRHHGGGQAAFPHGARTQATRHLLRHTKPARRHQAVEPASRHRHRGGQSQQFQQQPIARCGRQIRHTQLHGRQCV